MPSRLACWIGLVLLGMAGCATEPMRGVTTEGEVVPLWPIEPGSTWTYTFKEGGDAAVELVYRVARPIVLAGTTYTLVATTRDGMPADTLAVRNDRRGLFLHRYDGGNAAVGAGRFFRYPAVDGETYEFGGSVRVAYRTQTVLAGTFDVMCYTFDEGDGARSEIAFAPGVGLVASRNTQTAARAELVAYD